MTQPQPIARIGAQTLMEMHSPPDTAARTVETGAALVVFPDAIAVDTPSGPFFLASWQLLTFVGVLHERGSNWEWELATVGADGVEHRVAVLTGYPTKAFLDSLSGKAQIVECTTAQPAGKLLPSLIW